MLAIKLQDVNRASSHNIPKTIAIPIFFKKFAKNSAIRFNQNINLLLAKK